jgi:signal transduction histidine kinase
MVEHKMKVPVFKSLTWKMTVAYTLVTTIMLSIVMLMGAFMAYFIFSYGPPGETQYLNDVWAVSSAQFRAYLESPAIDHNALQAELENYCLQGVASAPASSLFDSPQAAIQEYAPVFIVQPNGKVLASCPQRGGPQIGEFYTHLPKNLTENTSSTQSEFNHNIWSFSERMGSQGFRLHLPLRGREGAQHQAILVVSIEHMPARPLSDYAPLLPFLLVSILFLMAMIAPFGALFGLATATGLTRRLSRLVNASEQWSGGNFETLQIDRSQDELGILNRKMRSMAEKIQTLMRRQQEMATLEERNRMARELHDTVKQQNFAIQMQIRAAQNLLLHKPEAARMHLQEAEDLLKTSQSELGVIINALRPAQLEGVGLVQALRSFVAEWSTAAKVPVDILIQNEQSLPIAQEEAFFRVAQEAFANVLRHSHASHAGLQLNFGPKHSEMIIRDNGLGFSTKSAEATGYGLFNMQLRVEELGGSFTVNSRPGLTEVHAVLPRLEE